MSRSYNDGLAGLSGDEGNVLSRIADHLQAARDVAEAHLRVTRPVSLGFTKLDEAFFWLREEILVGGVHPAEKAP